MAEYAISRITLRSRLQYGGLRPEEALALAADAGRALARAHAAGRIHGNLTPESFLLQGSSVSIQRFGWEGTTAEDVDYRAPERLAGGPPTVAGDIYSFGRILGQIQNSADLGAMRNREWETAVQRCLDPIPERRFPSVDSLLTTLGLDQRTISLASSPRGIKARKERKEWGQFQLLQRLGAGGFGEVYRAWEPTLEREVALKLLRPRGLKPDEEFAAIVAEGRAMARVRHPNTVSVHGVDRHDGRVGLWSDFIRGQTLACWVETEGLRTEKQTAEIGMALCDALSALHHAGLLHRDIKPGNAMRAEDGRILLMDFGLSHELHQEKGWGGTVEYMAPELLAGGQPSVQSDIYAMGVLLNYLRTGKCVLDKDSVQTKTERGPALSAALSKVIETATNVDPQKRYASAANLHDALAFAVSSASGTTRTRKKCAHTRIAWIAAAVVLLVAFVFLIPQVRREAQARFAGTNRAAYQDYLAAEDALARYDKPGNTQKAVDLYQKTLERSPNFALAQAGLARADWRMYLDTSDKKWIDAAGQAAASAAATNPNLAPVQTTLGSMHVEEGKVGLGIQELEQAKQLDPKSAEIRGAIGEAYRMEGRPAEAKTELQAAMDLAPENWRWPYLLGALEIDAGNFKAAESNLKLALEKTPDNARVLYNLGLVYRKQNRLPEAQQALEQSFRLDPRSSTIMALGLVQVLQGDYDDAVQQYERAAEMNPKDWKVWGNLAFARQWTGRDPDEAAKSFSKAIELASEELKSTPDDPQLNHALGSFYANLHDRKHALPFLRKAVLLAPNDPDNIENVAESYEALGDRDEALRLIEKALTLGFSPDYARKTPALRELRRDPGAPAQIRESTNSQQAKSKG